LKSKSSNRFRIVHPPQKFALRLWGNWGPQSLKQKKNASVWQAKIKAAKPLNHKPACVAGGTQSSPKAMSAGDLKENKKPFFEATHKKTVCYFLVALPHTTISFA
jgi:hypothetical protein